MRILTLAIIAFIILELLNVIILYFSPTSTKGNGLGVFNAFEKSKETPEVHALVKYLINWIAGTKLIFIALLIVIVIFADDKTQNLSVIALILSIGSFFWRLYPSIIKMDKRGEITPKGYAKTLGLMIFSFIVVFIVVLCFSIFF